MANGFFYKVGAKVDKQSFSDAIGELNKLREESKKLVAGIAGISQKVISVASAAGEVSAQELKMAKAIGVSSSALSAFKISAGVAGVSANGLVGSLAALERKMQSLKTGSVDAGLAKSLAMLKIGYNDFAKMDSTERMKAVFAQADAMKDQALAANLVSEVLGNAGREYYDALKLSGKSLESQLAESRALNFVSEKNRKDAMAFSMEVKAIRESGKSILQFFGTRLGESMLPVVRRIKGWIIENHALIEKSLSGLADLTAQTFDKIFGFISKVAPVVSTLINRFGGLDKLLLKVGIGFASAKAMHFAQGIAQVVKSVGLLKAGLGGLLTGGLGMIIEDIAYHFMGGGSFIFDDLLPLLDRLGKAVKEKFKVFGIDIDFSKIAKGVKEFGENIAKWLSGIDWDKIVDGAIKAGIELAKFAKGFGSDVWNLVQSAIRNIENLDKVITSLFKKDWKGAKENLKAFWDEFKFGMNADESTEVAKSAYQKTLDSGGSKAQAINAAAEAFVKNLPVIGQIASVADDISGSKKMREFIVNLFSPKKESPVDNSKKTGVKYGPSGQQMNDGIVSPSGRVISISPSDWVFALKDVSNLASAFVPSSITNNSTNQSASYVINQSYTVNGGKGEAVRAQAYKGTADAIRATIQQATRNRQVMQGAR